MVPCVVVERLEGKQRCSRAAVGEHAGLQAREWSKWLFTRNNRSIKNDQTPQQPITQSRQCDAQTTPAHLHWCGADPYSSWPAHAAGHRSDPLKRGYISAIFAGQSMLYCILWYDQILVLNSVLHRMIISDINLERNATLPLCWYWNSVLHIMIRSNIDRDDNIWWWYQISIMWCDTANCK